MSDGDHEAEEFFANLSSRIQNKTVKVPAHELLLLAIRHCLNLLIVGHSDFILTRSIDNAAWVIEKMTMKRSDAVTVIKIVRYLCAKVHPDNDTITWPLTPLQQAQSSLEKLLRDLERNLQTGQYK